MRTLGLIGLLATSVASAQQIAFTPATLSLQPRDAKAPPTQWGAQDSTWLTIGAGWATSFSNEHDYNLSIAWSTFIVEDLEMSLEGGLWSFVQKGDNEFGLNPNFVLRYHFINRQSWSMYADAGIGVLFATGNVPDSGTSFNLMPRAGVGATFRLDDAGTRLQAGVRWHHISNARIQGDTDNPARDRPMFYTGVVFPF